MPRLVSGPERWRVIGRLLPRDVRERVFDPAFSDLVYRWLTVRKGSRRLPFGVHALSTYLGCFPIAIPRLFVRDGRLTRLGRVGVWSAGVVALLVFAVSNLVDRYPSYGPP